MNIGTYLSVQAMGLGSLTVTHGTLSYAINLSLV